MRKLFQSAAIILLGAILALGIVACGKNKGSTKTEYTLSDTSITLEVGETKQLSVTATPAKDDFTVTYESANDAIATVSTSGLVTAVAKGNTTITAKVDGKMLTCSVTVNEQGGTTEYTYTITPTEATLDIGGTQQLTVTSSPAKQLTVIYKSSNDAVATVSESGLVTAVAEGTATITATVDGKALTCKITVNGAEVPPAVKYVLSPTEVTLEVEGTQQLTISEKDGNAVTEGVAYESSNKQVATVSASGLITAVGAGAANITAKIEGQELICSVIVKAKTVVTYTLTPTEVTLEAGEAQQLTVTASDGSTPVVTFASNDSAIAEVTAAGLVTAKAAGTTTITAKIGNQTLECKVTVTKAAEPTYAFTLNYTSIELKEEETRALVINVTPTPAADKTFTVVWTADDYGAVKVEGNGLTATVTALKTGEGTIKAVIEGTTLTCAYKVEGKEIIYNYSLQLNGEEFKDKDLELNELSNTATFTLVSDPEGADLSVARWLTDNDKVVKVEDGVVTAVGVGETDIYVTIGNETLKVHVKVTVATTATAKQDGTVKSALLSVNEGYDTLYWERYRNVDDINNAIIKKINPALEVTSDIAANFGSLNRFSDFGITLGWIDGDALTAWGGKQNNGSITGINDGFHLNGNITSFNISMKADENVKVVRLYTGAYNATNYITASINGIEIAATSFSGSGDPATCLMVDIEVNIPAGMECTLDVKIAFDGNNASLSGFAVLGENAAEPTTSISNYTKSDRLTADGGSYQGTTDWNPHSSFNLTDYGTLDWMYMNYEGDPDRKNTENPLIHGETLQVEGNSKGWDYQAEFKWTDGTKYPTSPNDNDANGHGTNNFVGGAYVRIDVTLTSEVDKLYLWTTGWRSSYYVLIIDSNGNFLVHQQVTQADEGIGNQAYMLTFDIDAPVDETVTVITYRPDANNASIAAIALGIKEEAIKYNFSLNKTESSLFDDGSETLTINVTPTPAAGKTFDVVWSATGSVKVEGEGLNATVTAISVGEGTVTVVINGVTLTCTYTVESKEIVYEYSLELDGEAFNENEQDLVLSEVNNTATFTVVSNPAGSPALSQVEWSTDNAAIVTVVNGVVKAVGVGETDIYAQIGAEKFKIHVKVEATLGVTAKLNDVSNVNLTNNHETFATLYWEHYRGYLDGTGRVDQMALAEDLITTNFQPGTDGDGFGGDWQFPIAISWLNGSLNPKKDGWRDLIHTDRYFELTIKVPANAKLIRLYAGAWNSTNAITLSVNGIELASTSITAGEQSVAKEVEFAIDTTTEVTAVIRLNRAQESGNVSVAAAVILGGAKETTTTLSVASKDEINFLEGGKVKPEGIVNISEIGTQDWYVLYGHDAVGSAHEAAYKNIENPFISRWPWAVSGGGWFTDFRAAFTWNAEDANRSATTCDDGDVDNATNDSCWYWSLRTEVKVNTESGKLHLWVNGYSATYYVSIFDSNGNKLFHEKMADNNGGSNTYHLVLDINASVEETLSVLVHMEDGGSNISMPALALAKKEGVMNYEYSLRLNGEQEEFKYNERDLELTELVNSATFTLLSNPTGSPALEDAEWWTDDNTVVTVEGGVVKAVGVGETDIYVRVGGETLKIHVKVSYVSGFQSLEKTIDASDVVGTVKLQGKMGDNDVLYWEHYDGYNNAGHHMIDYKLDMPGELDLVSTNFENNMESYATRGFNDYKIPFSWYDGRYSTFWYDNSDGLHTTPLDDDGSKPALRSFELYVKLDTYVKEVRVYVGAWNATNTVTVSANGLTYATHIITAGGNGIAQELTIKVAPTAPMTLTVKIDVSGDEETNGNANLAAIAVLGDASKLPAKEAATTTITEESRVKMGDPAGANKYNLSEIGTQDWFLIYGFDAPGSAHESAYKKDGGFIEKDSYNGKNSGSGVWFEDYGGAFTWNDADANRSTSNIDGNLNGSPADGYTNDSIWYWSLGVRVRVNTETGKLILFTGGWDSTYFVKIVDSHGNTLYYEKIAERAGVNNPYRLDLTVNATVEETLTVMVIMEDGGSNISMPAMALAKKA